MRIAASLLLIAACASEPGTGDITGPFTGTTHRFAVDAIDMPATNSEAREFADDLDGDGDADNQLGMVVASLASQDLTTKYGADMIAAGAIASSFEIVADDLMNDPTVSVLYRGADGEAAIAVGGEIIDGHFKSNRTRHTRVPGSVRAHLPVWADADPTVVDVEGLEIELTPDGRGGFDALVRGVVDPEVAKRAAYPGAMQMLAASPGGHMLFMRVLDSEPHDWVITEDEFVNNSLIKSLLSADIEYETKQRLSIGYRVHITPCASGRCASAPTNTCHDRVKDGDETGVDCGGSCGKCPVGGQCAEASDCKSNACNAGTCAAPSCTDGVRDGFETDVDCGSECGTCAVGAQCYADSDCESGSTCGAPCQEGDYFCDGYDRCQ